MNVKEVLLDDFEHGSMNKYGTNHSFVKSYGISVSNDHAKYGKSSLKVELQFQWLVSRKRCNVY